MFKNYLLLITGFFFILCLCFSSCEDLYSEKEYNYETLNWNSNAKGDPLAVRPLSENYRYRDIIPVSDGWVAVGSVSNSDYGDGIITKYNDQGEKQWEKAFGGSDLDSFYSIINISDGYIVLAGCASNDGNLKGLKKTTEGTGTTVIVKYDFDGMLLWAKELPVTAIIANDSGFMGTIGRKGDNKSNIEVVQFDSNGNTLRRRPIGNDLNFDAVFSQIKWTWNRCFIVSKILNSPNGYILFGRTLAEAGSMLPALENGPDVIVSVNTEGKILLQKELPYIITDNIIITTSDNIVFATYEGSIINLDLEMNQIWEVAHEYGHFQCLVEINENIYVTGNKIKSGERKAFIFGVNQNGEIFWDTGLQQVDEKECTFFPIVFGIDNGLIVYQYAYNGFIGEIPINSFRLYDIN